MIPCPESINYLIEYMAKDHDSGLNYTFLARESLIKIGVPAVKPLINSMSRADRRMFNNLHNEFRSITKGIGMQCLPCLADATRGGNLAVKRAAVNVISHFKVSDAAKPLADALHDRQLRYECQRGLKEIGAPSIKHLLPLLDDDDSEVRFSALVTLGSLGEQRALKPLLKALKDEKLKGAAIDALGGVKEPRAARRLIKLLKDKNSYIRMRAAVSLGSIGDKIAIDPLLEMLDIDKENQNPIIGALGKLGAVNASPKIMLFLKHANDQTRITAAEALLNIASPSSAAALVDALDDQEYIVRDYAYNALKRITKADCGIYPDAWKLWLERNKIPEPPVTREEKGVFKRIFLFLTELFQQITTWLEDIFS